MIIEAHACGLPVIGSDSGAIPAVVGDGGLIVPEGDVGALAGAIAQLYANPQRARALAEAGRRQVEQHYTWESVARQMADIYRTVATESGSPAAALAYEDAKASVAATQGDRMWR